MVALSVMQRTKATMSSYKEQNMSNYIAKHLLYKARGVWPEILGSLGINTVYMKNKHGPCPICGGKDRFRFDNLEGRGTFFCNQCGAGDGLKLIQLFYRLSFVEALKMLAQALGEHIWEKSSLSGSKCLRKVLNNSSLENQKPPNQHILDKRRRALRTTWRHARSLTRGDPVDCYLIARGIELDYFPSALKFHPELTYYNDDGTLLARFPAMLALIQNKDNHYVTIHRTYLGDGCKADVPKPKKLMPAIEPKASMGAAIKLYEPTNGKIVLAEGIETALSISVSTGLPVWATVSSGGMEGQVQILL